MKRIGLIVLIVVSSLIASVPYASAGTTGLGDFFGALGCVSPPYDPAYCERQAYYLRQQRQWEEMQRRQQQQQQVIPPRCVIQPVPGTPSYEVRCF